MASAVTGDMTFTSSLSTSQNPGKLVETGAGANSCRTCAAPVDLTMTVLVKNNRIVGCPACEWGSASVSRATADAPVHVVA